MRHIDLSRIRIDCPPIRVIGGQPSVGERPSAVHQSIDTSVGPLIVVGRIGPIDYKSAIRELKEGGDAILSQLQLVHDDVGGGDDESIREYVPIELQLVSVHRTINDLPQ